MDIQVFLVREKCMIVDIVEEQAILERIQGGDASACDDCVAMHQEGMIRLAMRLVSNRMEAEDIVQESFLNAFKAIDSFDGRSRLGTWLYRITYNTALMHLRKKYPYSISVEEPTFTQSGKLPEELFDWCCLPESDLLKMEALKEVGRAVDALPVSLKEVFIMREFEGVSTNGVAESLHLNSGTVKVRLHRARSALKVHLTEYFGDSVSFNN